MKMLKLRESSFTSRKCVFFVIFFQIFKHIWSYIDTTVQFEGERIHYFDLTDAPKSDYSTNTVVNILFI